MKTTVIAASIILSLANVAHAEQVWFALDAKGFPVPPDTPHFESAGDACKKGYDADVAGLAGNSGVDAIIPYRAPTLDEASGAYPSYTCKTTWRSKTGSLFDIRHLIYLVGTTCPDGTMLDLYGGKCISPDEFQARRQMGDPNNDPNNDPNDCQGNPINAAIGNKFESETDYTDTDGELGFHRYYNGLNGTWSHSYSAQLRISPASVTLTFDDGRASLFALDANGSAIAEASERGRLEQDKGMNWIYHSPSGEIFTFNRAGRLTMLTDAIGLSKTFTYGYDSRFNNLATVKDSRGHVLTFTKDFSNRLLGMAANGVTVTYTYNVDGRLTGVARSMQNIQRTRTYLYEVRDNPLLLTGIVDERGKRTATWQYDAQGRAIASEHAGGTDRVTIQYGDEDTVVTNALGHKVTYRYELVAGTRRMTSVSGEPTIGCPIANSSYTYDARGQIATQTNALSQVTAFTYDAQGRITAKTEAKGTPEERTTTTTWDGTSFRPATVTTPDRVTSYTYDANGHPLSTTVRSLKD